MLKPFVRGDLALGLDVFSTGFSFDPAIAGATAKAHGGTLVL